MVLILRASTPPAPSAVCTRSCSTAASVHGIQRTRPLQRLAVGPTPLAFGRWSAPSRPSAAVPTSPAATSDVGGGGGVGGGSTGGGGGGWGGSSGGGGGGLSGGAGGGSPLQKATMIFALTVAAGGGYAYYKKGSAASLQSSLTVAAALLASAWLLGVNPAFGTALGLTTTVGLASFMGRRYLDSGKVMPSGALALVSIAYSLAYAKRLLNF